MENKINIEVDKNVLTVILNSLGKEPHSNISVQPIFNKLLQAYQSLEQLEQQEEPLE
jgi:hypothetical protein